MSKRFLCRENNFFKYYQELKAHARPLLAESLIPTSDGWTKNPWFELLDCNSPEKRSIVVCSFQIILLIQNNDFWLRDVWIFTHACEFTQGIIKNKAKEKTLTTGRHKSHQFTMPIDPKHHLIYKWNSISRKFKFNSGLQTQGNQKNSIAHLSRPWVMLLLIL